MPPRRDTITAFRMILSAAVFALQLHQLVAASSTGFLLISAPRLGTISWVKLPDGDTYTAGATTRTLIDGLHHPQGIAVDQKRRRLYVADPDLNVIYGYDLEVTNDEIKLKGDRTVVNRNAESRWVSVDGNGNIFFSDEPRNLILKIPAEAALRGGGKATVVYAGSSTKEINEPGGVAADNFQLFWTNKHFGTEVGSIVRGGVDGGTSTSKIATALGYNAARSYGVCLALGNVYYTDAEKYLYGVKKGGGPIAEVSSIFKTPRGCAWDGDGTVYVADSSANAVYSFASNMQKLVPAQVSKVFDAEDAFGLAVVMAPTSKMGVSDESTQSTFGSIAATAKEFFAR